MAVLLEARPFRPFKSSEEYSIAMKEDLAEWLNSMYPELRINVDNFMDRLDTGVALCKHANKVRKAAEEYVARRQARKIMTGSITSSLAMPMSQFSDVAFLVNAKPGTFFARDNVSNFISWCRNSLGIIECLLFETDDLIMRKNERHVILCLLEVARQGAKFGMLAPMLVQMERQIDREIAAENKGVGGGVDDDSDDEFGVMHKEEPCMIYGPQPQIVTNDLKSLDEMVRELVERCTCPMQFPMIRVSEGKYRIGDTKVLIFVRILRNHVMVRVGGGWDTLSHYLDKHDPCRCRTSHRSTISARLIHKDGGPFDLGSAQVHYERSPTPQRKHQSGGSPVHHQSPEKLRSRSPTTKSLIRCCSPTRKQPSPMPEPQVQIKPIPEDAQQVKASVCCTRNPESSQEEFFEKEQSPKLLQNGDGEHSDNGSEVSDEGYRSLGTVQPTSGPLLNGTQDRPKKTAPTSKPGGSCVETYSIETGLRKTKRSSEQSSSKDRNPSKATIRESSNLLQKLPKDGIILGSDESLLKRASIEKHETRKNFSSGVKGKSSGLLRSKSGISNTWNGRQMKQRPSLKNDTFFGLGGSEKNAGFGFPRESGARQSLPKSMPQYDRNGRKIKPTSVSLQTSPTKVVNPLLEQIVLKVGHLQDDKEVIQKLQDLLKDYKGASSLLGKHNNSDHSLDFTKAWIDGIGNAAPSVEQPPVMGASPRKDPKADTAERPAFSRIPAPIHKRPIIVASDNV